MSCERILPTNFPPSENVGRIVLLTAQDCKIRDVFSGHRFSFGSLACRADWRKRLVGARGRGVDRGALAEPSVALRNVALGGSSQAARACVRHVFTTGRAQREFEPLLSRWILGLDVYLHSAATAAEIGVIEGIRNGQCTASIEVHYFLAVLTVFYARHVASEQQLPGT